MWARPGVKCVCVKQAVSGGYGDEIWPVVDAVYTVRAVHPDGDAIWLVEIVNAVRRYDDGMSEVSYCLDGFRPLVTQSDDIALFAHHLDEVPA